MGIQSSCVAKGLKLPGASAISVDLAKLESCIACVRAEAGQDEKTRADKAEAFAAKYSDKVPAGSIRAVAIDQAVPLGWWSAVVKHDCSGKKNPADRMETIIGIFRTAQVNVAKAFDSRT